MAEVIVCVGDTTTHGSAIVDHEARKIYKELICHIKPAIDLQVRLVGVQLCNGVLSLFLGSNLSTFSLFAHLTAAVERYPNTPEVYVGNVLHDEALNVIEVLAKVKFFEYAKMSDLTSDAPYVLASKHPVAVYKVATGKFVDNGSGVSPNEYASFNLPDIVDIHAAPPVSFMPKTHGGSNLSALGGSINTTDF